jgi:hypothetical protein
MHDTAAAGGYPLDLSGAGGPQLDSTPRRATREEDGTPAGPRGDSDHTAVAGPNLRGPARPSGWWDGQRRRRTPPPPLSLAEPRSPRGLHGPCGPGCVGDPAVVQIVTRT